MASNATATAPPANLTFQGIVVPGSSLNPKAFFAGTRRQYVLQKTLGAWQGFGNTDVVDTLRSGILAGYFVKLSGTLVVAIGSGTVASTARWPYYLLRGRSIPGQRPIQPRERRRMGAAGPRVHV